MKASEKWKPGDVAMVTQKGGNLERLSFRRGRGWICDIGEILDGYASRVRPLVVIDPEDREQVERLREAFRTLDCWTGDSVDDWQKALREFANPKPPKPDEPMGFAAVVVDRDGERWVSYRQDGDEWIQPWRKGEDHWADYADIDAVTVLSEGVQP